MANREQKSNREKKKPKAGKDDKVKAAPRLSRRPNWSGNRIRARINIDPSLTRRRGPSARAPLWPGARA